MAYQILRVQKLKSLTSVRRSLKHAFRTQETPNADPSRASQNQNFGANSDKQAMAKVKALIPKKLRKNGVVCVEHLVTASPEWFKGKSSKEQNAYFNDSLKWLREKWGKENVVCGGVHRDETTPHMYAYIVPKDHETGRLNCRKWLGERNALSNMQSQFHDDVSKNFGMERGLKGSKAKHQTIQKYYANLNAVIIPEHQKTTTKELVAQAFGKGKRINDLLEQASLVQVLSNENKSIKRANQEEQLRLVKINELSKKKNLELKEKFKDPIDAANRFHQKAAKAQSILDVNESMEKEIKELRELLRSSESKAESYLNIINKKENTENEHDKSITPNQSLNM